MGIMTAVTLTTINGSLVPGYPSDVSAFLLAVKDINDDPSILPETKIETIVCDTEGRPSGALACIIAANEAGVVGMVGPGTSAEATLSAIASSVYLVPQMSGGASAADLSDGSTYPFFSRVIPSDISQTAVFLDLLLYYNELSGQEQWKEIAVICTADDYGVAGAKEFIKQASFKNITVVAFQQFLYGATDIYQEVNVIKGSGSRIFLAFMFSDPFITLMVEALQQKIIADNYVWFCSDGCTTIESLIPDYYTLDKMYLFAERGLIGVLPVGGHGERYVEFLEEWHSLDPYYYPGTTSDPYVWQCLNYDATYALALTMHNLYYDVGNFAPNATEITNAVVNVTFIGVTGLIEFNEFGDRKGEYNVFNLLPTGSFSNIGYWDVFTGLNITKDAHWHSGTTQLPDLDYQPQFDYWSCFDKERKTDKTGKTVDLVVPKDNDPNNIDIKYECDEYIDCDNMSDESFQCAPSKVIGMIVIGIIVGVLVFVMILFIPFIIFFGWIIPRQRVVYAGRAFLLIVTLSCILGVISIFAWFGKPASAACGFRVWLLGLACLSLFSVMFAKATKNFTFWMSSIIPHNKEKPSTFSHLFRKYKTYHEFEIILVWFISLLPGILILVVWTIVGTPIAGVEKISGDKHYVCTTGMVGPPAGIAFFFILFGYLALLGIIGMIMQFFARKAPIKWNESRFTSISLFNMVFTGAVVTTIFLILETLSQFAAWIILFIGIIYGFTSTVLLHDFTKVVGIMITNRFKEAPDSAKPKIYGRKGGNVSDSSSLSGSSTSASSMA